MKLRILQSAARVAASGVVILIAQRLIAQQLIAQQNPAGPYRADQAAGGRAAYQAQCASCQAPDLTGREGPQLAGGTFMSQWGDKTAGELVAYLFDVSNGRILWETRLPAAVQGFPVTFAAGGKQYIAVTTSNGGGSPRNVPSVVANELRYPATGTGLYVFALPDRK